MIDYFIADDLSGVLDAAAAFHHAGRRVRIVLSPDAWTTEHDDDVIGVTTETRNADASTAARIVTRALAHGRAQGGKLVYKKIDSTLRGPVAAELAALASAWPEARVLFAPANPAVGRTVRDGMLFVRGVPLADTEFARDPTSPVKDSSLRAVLGDVAPGRIILPDTETEADLAAAVAWMEAAGAAWVAVGSGALARPVAARLARPKTVRVQTRHAVSSGPPLMVCGSAHPGNRAQAAALERERGVPIRTVHGNETQPAVEAAVADIRDGRGASLLTEDERRESAGVLRAITEAAVAIQAKTGVSRMFVTGGETAFALCESLGIRDLVYHAEIEAGLSVSCARRSGGNLVLAVKPGGFGGPDAWLRAWDALLAT